MLTINNYFEQAQISQASYSLGLARNMAGEAFPGYVEKLVAGGLSLVQAKTFANEYTVINQYTDPDSGFSGTIFQNKSGQIYMAMRGTEKPSFTSSAGWLDWSTNIADIGSDGIAIDQGIAMYNWYRRLVAPVGSTVTQYIYHKETTDLTGSFIVEPAWLEEFSVLVDDAGEHAGGSLVDVANVAVTGHSLGGHLAMIMSRIASDLVTSTLTYNAPRFDTNLAVDWSEFLLPHLGLSSTALTSDGFFNLLRAAEGKDGLINTGASWDIGEIINTRIEGDAVSLIGDLTGSAGQQQLFSEGIDENIVAAHDIAAVTDALAVYNLFGQVDSTLPLDIVTGLLLVVSRNGNNSLEAAVTKLGELFVDGFVSRVGNEYDSIRDLLYTDIQAINEALPDPSTLTIELLGTIDLTDTFTPFSPYKIENLARDDIAYRYALVKEVPLVLNIECTMSQAA